MQEERDDRGKATHTISSKQQVAQIDLRGSLSVKRVRKDVKEIEIFKDTESIVSILYSQRARLRLVISKGSQSDTFLVL